MLEGAGELAYQRRLASLPDPGNCMDISCSGWNNQSHQSVMTG
jgi:hypothetical protein